MRYYTANISIKSQMDMDDARSIVNALLGEVGFESFEDTDDGVRAYIQQQLYEEGAIEALQLDDYGIHIHYNIEEAEYKDWNADWEAQGFEPIMVGDCCIHDMQHLAPASARLDVTIEARQAFGTGTHQTTRMIVGELLNMDLKGKRVLDCGCGTGILGIVCSMCGAEHVTGYDIDEWSTENAKHNAMLNGVDMRILLGDSSVIPHEKFDLVLANINRNILLADMRCFSEALNQSGTLILSGFYNEDVEILTSEASKHDLLSTSIKHDGDWACIVLQKE